MTKELELRKSQLETCQAEVGRYRALAEFHRRASERLQAEVALLQQGVGWSLLAKYRRVRVRFVPPGSRRERLYRALVGAGTAAPATWPPPLQRRLAVVIATHDQTTLVAECVESVRASLQPASQRLLRVVVIDDGSRREVQAWLRRLPVDLILRANNQGYARTANAGLARLAPGEDFVFLNNDTLVHPGCFEALQSCAYSSTMAGILGAKCLYPDGRIQSAGSYRNLDHPEWFDHCYRFQPEDHPPANVQREVFVITGACMYVKRGVLDAIGPLDTQYPMAFEDVEYCLRARQAGFQIVYCPHAAVTHLEGYTRGEHKEARELLSMRRFWQNWGDHFDGRRAWDTSPDRFHIIYVLQDTGVGGGHRVIFEQLNRLARRGHRCEVYSLAQRPQWFPLEVPLRTFPSYEALTEELAGRDAIKVATWWETAERVWLASLDKGIPVYLPQDIETSYYRGEYPEEEARVLASYRKEFWYITDATWTQKQLRALGVSARVIPPGVDDQTFRPLGLPRENNVVLSVGRTEPLKNIGLLLGAIPHVKDLAALWMYGIEPDVGRGLYARYHTAPTDTEVAELFNRATLFVLTSMHEGFGLPILEAMACGCPVVCTNADGNMDFCRDGENCLIVPRKNEGALADTIARLLGDEGLQSRLREAGYATARQHTWPRAIDALEAFYREVAAAGSSYRAHAPTKPSSLTVDVEASPM